MRAAAQLHRVTIQRFWLAADLHNPNDVAVFLAKKLNDVFSLFRLCERNFRPRNRRILRDFFIHQFFHVVFLFWREWRA